MVTWLQEGVTVLAPDTVDGDALHLPGVPLRNTESIREVSRTPLQLIWSIADDPFARYVVHCCARYHEIVSFSKETSGIRLTYLLRLNVTRPDFRATAMFDSPPITDLDYSSQIDTESDVISDREAESDPEAQPPRLSAISESSAPFSSPLGHIHDDVWFICGDSDAEGDESGSEVELAGRVESLSVQEHTTPIPQTFLDSTPRAEPRIVMRNRMWESRQIRSASSPSRSPARRLPRRVRLRVDPPTSHKATPPSFYDYVFG